LAAADGHVAILQKLWEWGKKLQLKPGVKGCCLQSSCREPKNKKKKKGTNLISNTGVNVGLALRSTDKSKLVKEKTVTVRIIL
jgi:hypothetical protein